MSTRYHLHQVSGGALELLRGDELVGTLDCDRNHADRIVDKLNGDGLAGDPADRCPSCGADRKTIKRNGHYLVGNGFIPDSEPCPEACSCAPECFSMEEHNRETGR